jgi:sulfopyruvate decarboxylase alpha subunit
VSVPAAAFVGELKRHGFDFFTGVPCSFLGAILDRLQPEGYRPAVREDAAVGLAAGAYLAGRRPVVLMQNSGLGVSLNALASLNLIYRIPVLLVVSLRGYQIEDAPEHWVMGEVTPRLLETVKIPSRIVGEATYVDDCAAMAAVCFGERLPAALLIRKGLVT